MVRCPKLQGRKQEASVIRWNAAQVANLNETPLKADHSNPTYRYWAMLKRYSFNKNTDGYKNYGAKGIVLCKRWETFKYFLEDVGLKPGERGVFLRRKNEEIGFEPGNCVWDKRKSSDKGYKLTYISYKGMLERCYCVDHASYGSYGEKGVKVFEPWRTSFWHFLKDIGHRPSKDHVLSRVGDKGNYEPGNCFWKLRSENEKERTPVKGEKQHLAKIKESDIPNIRKLHLDGVSFTEIGKKYKVNRTTIARIIRGKTWKHVS